MEDGLGGLLFGASSDSFVVRYSVDDIGLWDPCDVSKFCTTSGVFVSYICTFITFHSVT